VGLAGFDLVGQACYASSTAHLCLVCGIIPADPHPQQPADLAVGCGVVQQHAHQLRALHRVGVHAVRVPVMHKKQHSMQRRTAAAASNAAIQKLRRAELNILLTAVATLDLGNAAQFRIHVVADNNIIIIMLPNQAIASTP
jgi:hypothetical protein